MMARSKEYIMVYNGAMGGSPWHWSKVMDIPESTLRSRLQRGWSPEEIVFTPPDTTRRSKCG